MVTMTFTREFTKGNLEGLQHKDKMPFTTPERALEWVTIINKKAALGQLDYLVVSYELS